MQENDWVGTGPLSGGGKWRGRLRWFYTGIWLTLLAYPIYDLAGSHHLPLWSRAIGVATITSFVVAYLTLVGTWDKPYTKSNARHGLVLALGLIALFACVMYGEAWMVLWTFVSVSAGVGIARRAVAFRCIMAIFAVFLLMGLVTHSSSNTILGLLLPVPLTGMAMIGFRAQVLLINELGEARETVARLAANEERLRLARDLHDLTGHSLSLITLKSELAGRLVDADPTLAKQQIADVERVSRQTLHDIREAVSGYRRPTLAVELSSARTALEAAGIDLEADAAVVARSGGFDPEAEAVLAWCLREAITNVIRHSGAAKCRIRLIDADINEASTLTLEVVDDGGDPKGSGTPGNGQRGLIERLEAVGGRLEAGACKRGYRLAATVPYAPEPEREAALAPEPASPVAETRHATVHP